MLMKITDADYTMLEEFNTYHLASSEPEEAAEKVQSMEDSAVEVEKPETSCEQQFVPAVKPTGHHASSGSDNTSGIETDSLRGDDTVEMGKDGSKDGDMAGGVDTSNDAETAWTNGDSLESDIFQMDVDTLTDGDGLGMEIEGGMEIELEQEDIQGLNLFQQMMDEYSFDGKDLYVAGKRIELTEEQLGMGIPSNPTDLPPSSPKTNQHSLSKCSQTYPQTSKTSCPADPSLGAVIYESAGPQPQLGCTNPVGPVHIPLHISSQLHGSSCSTSPPAHVGLTSFVRTPLSSVENSPPSYSNVGQQGCTEDNTMLDTGGRVGKDIDVDNGSPKGVNDTDNDEAGCDVDVGGADSGDDSVGDTGGVGSGDESEKEGTGSGNKQGHRPKTTARKTTTKTREKKVLMAENDVENAKEREVKRKEREEKKKRELEKLGIRGRSQRVKTDTEKGLVHIKDVAASNKRVEVAQARKTLRKTG
jgi:hypothetical protein